MTDLDEIYSRLDRQQLLASLDPKLRGDYYQLTCPSCGKKEAYIYKDGRAIKCNRAANCGFSISLFDWVRGSYGLSSNRDVVLFLARFAGILLRESGDGRGGGKHFGESGGYSDDGSRSSEGQRNGHGGEGGEAREGRGVLDIGENPSSAQVDRETEGGEITQDRGREESSFAGGRGDGDNSMSARASGEGRKSGGDLAGGVNSQKQPSSKKQRSTTSTTASDTKSEDYDRWWLRGTFDEENEKDEKIFSLDKESPSKDGELSASVPTPAPVDSSSAHDHLIHADENLLEVALQFFQAQFFSKEGKEGECAAAPGAGVAARAAAAGEGAVARGEVGEDGRGGKRGKRGDDKRGSDSLSSEGLLENDLNRSEYSAKSGEHSDGTSTHSNSTPNDPSHENSNEAFDTLSLSETDPTKTASFCLNYLHRRGYSKDEIKWMELGYYPSQQALRNFLQMGHSDQEIARFEKILFTKNFGVTHQLVIPFRDGRGHLVGFILRSLLDEQELARHGERKYKYNAGLKPGSLFFNFHRAGWIGDGALDGALGDGRGEDGKNFAWGDKTIGDSLSGSDEERNGQDDGSSAGGAGGGDERTAEQPSSFNPIQKPKFPKAPDRLVVVEGYLDALVCSARGFPNVVAVGGAMPTQRQVSHAVKMGAKSFVFALDNDSDFSNVAKRVQRSLQLVHDRGARGYVVDWGKVGRVGEGAVARRESVREGGSGGELGVGWGSEGHRDGRGDDKRNGRGDALSSEGLLKNDLNGSEYSAKSDKHAGGESVGEGGDDGGGRDDKKDFSRIKDPDELIKRQGISAFVSLVENALTGQRWLATSLLQKYGLGAQGGWDQDDGRVELGGGTTGSTPVGGGPVDGGAVGDGSVGTEKTDFANTAPSENTPPNRSIEFSLLHSRRNLTDIQRDDLIERALQIGQTLVDPLANRDFFQVICRGIGITLEDLSPRIKDYRYRELKRQQRLDYGKFLTRANRMLLRGDMGQLGSYLKHELYNLNAKNVEEVLHPYTQDMARADIAKRGDGLRTGIDYLDRYFLIPKEAITVVAGRPAHGKTTLLLNIFLNMIELYPDKKFFFFSYEQSKSELYIRIINILAGHRLDQYKNLSKIEAYLRDGGGTRGGESNGWGEQGERGTHWSGDGRGGGEQYGGGQHDGGFARGDFGNSGGKNFGENFAGEDFAGRNFAGEDFSLNGRGKSEKRGKHFGENGESGESGDGRSGGGGQYDGGQYSHGDQYGDDDTADDPFADDVGGTHWSGGGRRGGTHWDSRRGGDSREDGGGRGDYNGGRGGQYGGTDGSGHWVIPEIERAKQKYNELVASGRLWLVEEPYHISELTDTMDFLSQKYSDVGACFIDYIQKIKTKEKYQSRQVEIQKTSAELLESAKRNHYPVIVGAQFNREVQDIGGVNMSSLRESGDIEQDASLILGLFNGAFTLAETDGEEMPSGEIDLTLKIIKNRNGLVNKSATLLWDLPVSKIKSKHDLG